MLTGESPGRSNAAHPDQEWRRNVVIDFSNAVDWLKSSSPFILLLFLQTVKLSYVVAAVTGIMLWVFTYQCTQLLQDAVARRQHHKLALLAILCALGTTLFKHICGIQYFTKTDSWQSLVSGITLVGTHKPMTVWDTLMVIFLCDAFAAALALTLKLSLTYMAMCYGLRYQANSSAPVGEEGMSNDNEEGPRDTSRTPSILTPGWHVEGWLNLCENSIIFYRMLLPTGFWIQYFMREIRMVDFEEARAAVTIGLASEEDSHEPGMQKVNTDIVMYHIHIFWLFALLIMYVLLKAGFAFGQGCKVFNSLDQLTQLRKRTIWLHGAAHWHNWLAGSAGEGLSHSPERTKESSGHAIQSSMMTMGISTNSKSTDMYDYHKEPRACPVCFDPLDAVKVRLRCGHMFCDPCLTQWLKIESTCPVCRADVPMINGQCWGGGEMYMSVVLF